jgi:GPH family glycoside/pentoside/hexuronide:cation symporter
MVRLSRRIGKRAVYIIGAAALIVHVASWLLAEPGEPMWKIGCRAALLGLASAGNIMMASSMLTDTIRYDTVTTGKRREASYMAIYSFVEKLAGAIGPLIAGLVLSAAGLDKAGLERLAGTSAVRDALDLTVVAVPILCYLLSILTLFFYRLSPAMLERTNGVPERSPGL